VIVVENESHCDFVKLRHLLVRSHMEELRDRTNNVLYESYRRAKMSETRALNAENPNPTGSKIEQEKELHEKKMTKMEAEMKAVFQQKVAEKETKLKQSEEEVYETNYSYMHVTAK
jgi:septin 7